MTRFGATSCGSGRGCRSTNAEATNGTVEAIAEPLFTDWVLAFEATALLLTIAAAGGHRPGPVPAGAGLMVDRRLVHGSRRCALHHRRARTLSGAMPW